MRIFLVRHGQTDMNGAGVWQGAELDTSLNALGREQAERAARYLDGQGIQTVYSSDLLRARQTAEPIARAAEAPIVLLPGLREVALGTWSGKTRAEAQALNPELFGAPDALLNTAPEGGESARTLQARVMRAFHAVLASKHKAVAVVSHGMALRVLLCALLDVPLGRRSAFATENGGVSLIETGPGGISVKYINAHGPMLEA